MTKRLSQHTHNCEITIPSSLRTIFDTSLPGDATQQETVAGKGQTLGLKVMGNFVLDDFGVCEFHRHGKSDSCYLEAGKGDSPNTNRRSSGSKKRRSEFIGPMIIGDKSKSSAPRPLDLKTLFINCPLLPIINSNRRQVPGS